MAEHSQTGGSALVLPLLLGSATFIWAGVGFWVAASGALSFALGPPFALLGLAVLVTRGAMRAARLSWKTRGDELHWTLSVGGLPIASRTLSAVGGQYARLRPGGARGWSIEWVGPEGTWALVGSLTASDVARFNIPLERIFSEMNQA